MKINEYHKLTCHCGSVELELHLPNGLENPRRCDWSPINEELEKIVFNDFRPFIPQLVKGVFK